MSESQFAESTRTEESIKKAELEIVFNHYLKNEVKESPKRILSVGCGFGYEATPLLQVFPGSKYLGIDIDESPLPGAKEVNSGQEGVEFEVGDATKRETLGEEPWDMIVARNPQVLGPVDKAWEIILNNCFDALKVEGIMFFSTPSEQERDRVIQSLDLSRKMKVVINEENKFRLSSGTFRDDYIIIAQKNSK